MRTSENVSEGVLVAPKATNIAARRDATHQNLIVLADQFSQAVMVTPDTEVIIELENRLSELNGCLAELRSLSSS